MAGPWNAGLTPGAWSPSYGNSIPLVQYNSFSMAASATSQASPIVAASSTYRVLLLAATLVAQGTAAQLSTSSTALNFQGTTSSTQATATSIWPISGSVTAPPTVTLPYSPVGWFATAAGDGLSMLMGTASCGVTGIVTFIYI